MAEVIAHQELEKYFIRYSELDSRQSSFHPFDTRLPRYQRTRYSVVGRPKEGTTDGKYHDDGAGFSVVYLKIEAGKGVGMHAHASSEVFIPMSGKWRVQIEGGMESVAFPWDVLSVPPNLMHGLENISDETAFIMAINSGNTGAPIRFSPDLIEELRSKGEEVADLELPGESLSKSKSNS